MTTNPPKPARMNAARVKGPARAKVVAGLADAETKSIEEGAEPLGANFA